MSNTIVNGTKALSSQQSSWNPGGGGGETQTKEIHGKNGVFIE
jgi:hypothetical protein